MKLRIACLAALLAASTVATADAPPTTGHPLLRFALNVSALEGALMQPTAIMAGCEKNLVPLPEDIGERFAAWRLDNKELLDNIARWSTRTNEIVGLGSNKPPEEMRKLKEEFARAEFENIDSVFRTQPKEEIAKRCRAFSEMVGADSITNDQDLREHFHAAKELEPIAFGAIRDPLSKDDVQAAWRTASAQARSTVARELAGQPGAADDSATLLIDCMNEHADQATAQELASRKISELASACEPLLKQQR